MKYSQAYLEHFTNPQNNGEMADADAVADVAHTGGGCFDRVRIFAKLNGDRIERVTYQCRACSGTIAACSMMSEMAKKMSLKDALHITGSQVAERLGGVPDRKQHSVDLAAQALRAVAEKLTESE
jgi:NifU-like protein involved in Fe-S cluster formation